MTRNTKFVTLIALLFSFAIASCAPTANNNPEEIENNTYTFNVVAFNDFHGAIKEDGNRMGLVKLGSYLKEQSDKENTLVLAQGDDWQGSIYSNYNHGKLVNDVYAYARVDARTIGNHDFDWGVSYLKENTAREYDGYRVPVLAANVYGFDYATKTVLENQLSDVGQKSVTYTLENGLKVGIVGTIGQGQITSICSSFMQDIHFVDHIQTIKDEARALKNDGCDFVIASVHTSQNDLINNDLENYVDLVLCGHSHYHEGTEENGLHYEQFGAYGELIGNISIKYNKTDKKIEEYKVDTITNSSTITINQNVKDIVDTYNSECEEIANEVLANNVPYYFISSENASNLMAKAICDEAIAEGYDDVILSYVNTARSNLPNNQITYADLYQSFPFDNEVCIVEVRGEDILNEIKRYNNVCYAPTFDKQINRYNTYKIAVIDYLIYHNNRYRYYDYFPSFTGMPITTLNNNYRIILKDWLKKNGYNSGKIINAFNYSSSEEQFNRELLSEVY